MDFFGTTLRPKNFLEGMRKRVIEINQTWKAYKAISKLSGLKQTLNESIEVFKTEQWPAYQNSTKEIQKNV